MMLGRQWPLRACGLALLLGCAAGVYAQGPVGYWKLDEGTGSVAADSSGSGNTGTITGGATWTTNGRNACLLLDGINDQVSCGNAASLNPTSAVSVRVWIWPEVRPVGEKGIVVKHALTSYGLTMYQDNNCWWYVAGGGNAVKAYAPIANWTQITCTYDGATTKIYANGVLAESKSLSGSIPTNSNPLQIGNRGETNQRFRGLVDEVQVYNRALSAAEVLSLYQQESPLVLSNRPTAASGPLVTGTGFTARVGSRGGIQIDIGADRYFVDSSYSYPGAAIGLNYLSQEGFSSGGGWSPVAIPNGAGKIQVTAAGSHYSLSRSVEATGGRLKIADTLTNTTASDVGILINNLLIARGGIATAVQPLPPAPSAENPTALLTGAASSLGSVVEDDRGRVHYERTTSQNQASFGSRFFALKPGASYTFEFTLYPSAPAMTYPAFMKQIRADWNAVFPIQGPIGWMDANAYISPSTVPAIASYLTWKKMKYVVVGPWLDYDPWSMSYVMTRQQFKDMMLPALAKLRQADPNIRILGAIETDWVTIYPGQIPNGNLLPQWGGGTSGQVELTPAQTAIIDNANLPWHDSYKRTSAGNVVLELYGRGGQPQTAISVYPEVGNYQYTFLMNQIDFLINECGFDGFYIDEFSQAWNGPLRSYNTRFNGTTWDGSSVDLDHTTGQIVTRWIDCSTTGIQARVNIAHAALDVGKLIIANSNASSRAEQSLPYNRFNETFSQFDPMSWPLGTEPPHVPYLERGLLNTPLAYGIAYQSSPPLDDYAQRLIKGLLMYLRHGLVYCHGVLPDPSPAAGEFGPVNHMFPITITDFDKGWVRGPERIITAISRTFDFPQGPRPTVLMFNEVGKPVSANATITPSGLGWSVVVTMSDWAQIGVITVDTTLARADFDRSGEVDDLDLTHFLGCMTGPEAGPPVTGCGDADLDLDSDVDVSDFGRFQRCISGSLTPAVPTCAD